VYAIKLSILIETIPIFLVLRIEIVHLLLEYSLYKHILFLAISYNQPELDPMASWRADAITFADYTTIGYSPQSIFINVNNTLYLADPNNNGIRMWLELNMTSTTLISSNLLNPYSLFVSSNGDIYIGNSYPYNRVDQWTLNTTTNILQMSTREQCSSIFVDIKDTLYCSIANLNQVIAKSLNSESNTLRIVAGTGCADNSPDRLDSPRGIFVDINFDLYVADCGNNRIQHFRSGQLNGTTAAVNGALGTITLSCPTGVVLDADKYLFIVDSSNHRIIGSGPAGFRCVAGCFGPGSAPNQLNNPQSMAFDSYGNIFVADTNNNRIQKFVLIPNLCGEY
jgi:hypothetical protein